MFYVVNQCTLSRPELPLFRVARDGSVPLLCNKISMLASRVITAQPTRRDPETLK